MDISIIVFLLGGLFLGWSLGANDAANVFGTAVGTKMVRFKTAAIICSIFIVLGAIISGAGTTETLGKLGSINALPGAFAACGDWMLRLHADFTVGADGAAVGDWVGPLGMVDPDVPVFIGEMEAASTKDFPMELFNPSITDPIWSSETNTRDMTGYNIYRDGAMVGEQDPDWTEYWDEGLDWGTYSYYVTAQYSDHESIATNEVEVTLSNVAPDAVMLISPGDGLEVTVDEGNLGEIGRAHV